MFQVNDTVYVGTQRRYLGKGTVVEVCDAEAYGQRVYLVRIGQQIGRVAEDQMFTTAKAARENATTTIFHG